METINANFCVVVGGKIGVRYFELFSDACEFLGESPAGYTISKWNDHICRVRLA